MLPLSFYALWCYTSWLLSSFLFSFHAISDCPHNGNQNSANIDLIVVVRIRSAIRPKKLCLRWQLGAVFPVPACGITYQFRARPINSLTAGTCRDLRRSREILIARRYITDRLDCISFNSLAVCQMNEIQSNRSFYQNFVFGQKKSGNFSAI